MPILSLHIIYFSGPCLEAAAWSSFLSYTSCVALPFLPLFLFLQLYFVAPVLLPPDRLRLRSLPLSWLNFSISIRYRSLAMLCPLFSTTRGH